MSSKPAKKERLHPRFSVSVAGETVCLRSAPSVSQSRYAFLFHVNKTLLSNAIHVFEDMLTVVEVASDGAEIVQLAEDWHTIALLLDCLSDDLQSLPDLVKVCSSGSIRFYAGAFKYGMLHAQHLAEQDIR
jgi:hypothetical protein